MHTCFLRTCLAPMRRYWAVTCALMIGVALVSMMAVFGSSTKASINKEIEKNFKADYLVSNSIGSDFSTAVGDEVAKVDGVATVSRVRWGMGEVGDGQEWIAAIDPATFGQVATLDTSAEALANLDRGGLLLDADTATELGLKTGDKVRMKLSGKPFDATVAGTYAATAGSAPARYLLSTKTWDANGGKLSDGQVYVRLTDGADAAAVGSALDKIVADLPTVSVKDVAGYAEEQAKPINQMLMIIYALLGLAVVIAILGIINTLALSVIERTREIGLLRAVGLSRRQLRSMLRLESVVIALLGATLGVVLGVVFGMAIQRALADEGFSTLQIPWVQLVAFVLMAGIVGVLAAVWPGRRAAKLKILDAIGSE